MVTGDVETANDLQQLAGRFPLLARAAHITTWALALCVCVRVAIFYTNGSGIIGQDAHAYWLTGQRTDLYGAAPGAADAFLYSPAFAQAISPLTHLPWPHFFAAWVALEVAALVWLLKPLPLRWAVPLAGLCLPELFVGNIYLLLATVAALGLRYPAVWAFAILTKIAPGVGTLWFIVRGEWAAAGVCALATAGVAAVSFAYNPHAWVEWATFLAANQTGSSDGGGGFALRAAAAVLLVVVGARLNRPWVVPAALFLASPVGLSAPAVAVLAALPRLMASGGRFGVERVADRDESDDDARVVAATVAR